MKQDSIKNIYEECSNIITQKTDEACFLLQGEGNYNADIMIIFDRPSKRKVDEEINLLNEEKEVLNNFLHLIGSNIEETYITHYVKYRTYKVNANGKIVSRKANREEVELFKPYLEKEINIIKPKIIITIGTAVFRWVSGDNTVKLNVEEDQLLLCNIANNNFKIYPIFSPISKQFELSQKKLIEEDAPRLQNILKNVVSSKKEVIQEVKQEDIEEIKEYTPRIFKKIDVKEDIKVSKYITIIYGGEGYGDDATLFAVERMSKVLTELGIGLYRFDLYKKDIDYKEVFKCFMSSMGVALAVNVEWYGIGARMQKFLDHLFFEGEERYFKDKPLFGISISRHAFEREAYRHLLKSWEILGGYEGSSIQACINKAAELELNNEWINIIDKKIQNYYRLIESTNEKLPTSLNVKNVVIESIVETKNEFNESFNEGNTSVMRDYSEVVVKQQDNVRKISSLFKNKLSNRKKQTGSLIEMLENKYIGIDKKAKIQIMIDDRKSESIIVELNNNKIKCNYGQLIDVDVIVMGEYNAIMDIVKGEITMQRSFMTGIVKAKGDFSILYKFEEYFDTKKL